MSTCSENFQNYVEKGKEADILPLFVTYADEEKFNDVKTWTNSTIIQVDIKFTRSGCSSCPAKDCVMAMVHMVSPRHETV
jgi:hypothetical protein